MTTQNGKPADIQIYFVCPMQGVYKFNQANFQEIPGGILRKIQDMFALLRPPLESRICQLSAAK